MLTRGLERDGYHYVWLDVGWWQGTRNAGGEIVVSPHAVAARDGVAGEHAARGGLEGGPVHRRGHQRLWRAGAGQLRPLPAGRRTRSRRGASTRSRWTTAGASSRAWNRRARTGRSTKRSSTTRATARCCCRSATSCSRASTKAKSRRSRTRTSPPTRSGRARATAGARTPTWASRGTCEFTSVLRNLDADAAEPQAAGPGHWNDPDYLGPDQGMSATQFRSQFSMWAMLAAPLMVSEDLVSMSSATPDRR